MKDDRAEELIGAFTQASWLEWVKAGWLAGIQEEFGPLNGKREEAIFETAWKLGFAHTLSLGRSMADELMAHAQKARNN